MKRNHRVLSSSLLRRWHHMRHKAGSLRWCSRERKVLWGIPTILGGGVGETIPWWHWLHEILLSKETRFLANMVSTSENHILALNVVYEESLNTYKDLEWASPNFWYYGASPRYLVFEGASLAAKYQALRHPWTCNASSMGGRCTRSGRGHLRSSRRHPWRCDMRASQIATKHPTRCCPFTFSWHKDVRMWDYQTYGTYN